MKRKQKERDKKKKERKKWLGNWKVLTCIKTQRKKKHFGKRERERESETQFWYSTYYIINQRYFLKQIVS